jgi:hypothetical protein
MLLIAEAMAPAPVPPVRASTSVPALYDRTVVVVTCFDTPYAETFTPYANTGGNYNLTSTWVLPPATHGGYP